MPALRAYLGRLLDLDAASDLIVLASSAPATPGVFTLKAKVDLAGVVQVRGSRLALALPGLPPAPAPVQRTGVPRRVGVKVGSDLQWSWRAKVKAPAGWEPVLANLDRSTGLRTLRWSGEAGHLFGSVTSADIAADLAAKGFEVDRRKIVLNEPLKTVGDHSVAVKLHREVTAHVKVTVVAEATDEVAAAEPAAAVEPATEEVAAE